MDITGGDVVCGMDIIDDMALPAVMNRVLNVEIGGAWPI